MGNRSYWFQSWISWVFVRQGVVYSTLLVLAASIGPAQNRDDVEIQLNRLKDGAITVRTQAVQALGKLGDSRAIEPLMILLQSKTEPAIVRYSSARSLGEIKNPRAVGALIAVLEGDDGEVKFNAVEALGAIGDPRAIDPLLHALEGGGAPIFINCIARALGELKATRAVVALSRLLRHDESSTRSVVAWSLGEIRDAGAVKSLVATLKDEDSSVALISAASLGKIGDASAVSPLLSLLKTGLGLVQEEAALSLGKIRDPESVGPLVEFLTNKNAAVRGCAALALGAIGDTRALAPLTTALRDGDPAVRLRAIDALGYIGDPGAIAPLIGIINLEINRDLFCHTVAALNKLGPLAVDPMVAALKGRAYYSEEDIAALAEFHTPQVAELLMPMMALGRNDRLNMELAKFGESATPLMIKALEHGRAVVRMNAAEVLGLMRDAQSVEALMKALQDQSSEVRESVRNALDHIGEPAWKALVKDIAEGGSAKRECAAKALILSAAKIDGASPFLRKAFSLVVGEWNYREVIENGDPYAELPLAIALILKGNKKMAEDFLNCGNAILADVARAWAESHGGKIVPGPGTDSPVWKRGR